jgi:hypothetical protein
MGDFRYVLVSFSKSCLADAAAEQVNWLTSPASENENVSWQPGANVLILGAPGSNPAGYKVFRSLYIAVLLSKYL